MTRTAVCMAMLALPIWLVATAQDMVNEHDHSHHQMEAETVNENQAIRVTINPEARVSVTRGRISLPASRCGETISIPVQIVNQGFVTAPVEVRLVGDVPPGVTVDFPAKPLDGSPQELRLLRITLSRPGPTDVSFAFKLPKDAPDLGGRGLVHFLLACT